MKRTEGGFFNKSSLSSIRLYLVLFDDLKRQIKATSIYQQSPIQKKKLILYLIPFLIPKWQDVCITSEKEERRDLRRTKKSRFKGKYRTMTYTSNMKEKNVSGLHTSNICLLIQHSLKNKKCLSNNFNLPPLVSWYTTDFPNSAPRRLQGEKKKDN